MIAHHYEKAVKFVDSVWNNIAFVVYILFKPFFDFIIEERHRDIHNILDLIRATVHYVFLRPLLFILSPLLFLWIHLFSLPERLLMLFGRTTWTPLKQSMQTRLSRRSTPSRWVKRFRGGNKR